MARGFVSTARVKASPDEVFATLVDWERAPEWMAGIDSMAVTEGDGGVGSTVTFRARGKDRTSAITEFEAGTSVTTVSTQGGITATYRYSVEPDGESAKITLRAQCVADGLLWKAASPLIATMMQRSDSGQPDALRRLIESGEA